MSVRKDPSGRRYVEVEVEVPGTPELVWQAIATGPGISSWFVPYAVEERVGGVLRGDFGPGMESLATVTAWDPPHRFTAESGDLGTEAPPIATEWIVEARSGGTCVVRVVHSWFASTDDWDAQVEGFEAGWPAFFRILRLYLTHFPGQTGTSFQCMGASSEPKDQVWARLTGALGIAGAGLRQRVRSREDAPPLAGVVEHAGPPEYPEELLIRLDEPGPGLAHLFAMVMGGITYLPVRFYLYGAPGHAAAAQAGPVWQQWMQEQFPMDLPEAPSSQ